MLDIRWIRENPDALIEALEDRGWEPDDDYTRKFPPSVETIIEQEQTPAERRRRAVEAIAYLENTRRLVISRLQDAQTERNTASKKIGQAISSGETARAQELKSRVSDIKESIQ